MGVGRAEAPVEAECVFSAVGPYGAESTGVTHLKPPAEMILVAGDRQHGQFREELIQARAVCYGTLVQEFGAQRSNSQKSATLASPPHTVE